MQKELPIWLPIFNKESVFEELSEEVSKKLSKITQILPNAQFFLLKQILHNIQGFSLNFSLKHWSLTKNGALWPNDGQSLITFIKFNICWDLTHMFSFRVHQNHLRIFSLDEAPEGKNQFKCIFRNPLLSVATFWMRS